MRLHKYLKRLYVWHGQPEITMYYDNITFMPDDIDDKLETLCRELFGVGVKINWVSNND